MRTNGCRGWAGGGWLNYSLLGEGTNEALTARCLHCTRRGGRDSLRRVCGRSRSGGRNVSVLPAQPAQAPRTRIIMRWSAARRVGHIVQRWNAGRSSRRAAAPVTRRSTDGFPTPGCVRLFRLPGGSDVAPGAGHSPAAAAGAQPDPHRIRPRRRPLDRGSERRRSSPPVSGALSASIWPASAALASPRLERGEPLVIAHPPRRCR